MSIARCPNGHQSATSDWCDTCGEPIGGSSPAPAKPGGAITTQLPKVAVGTTTCVHCGAENPGDALFCEQCGYDFTTGQTPPPDVPAPTLPAPVVVAPTSGWVAEVTADRDWYANKSTVGTEPFPDDQAPRVVALAGSTVLIGRQSTSRGVFPEIDAGDDSAVSRRHAQLVSNDDGWQVVDLDSTNGTYVQPAGSAPPDDALTSGQPAPVADGDSVLVGAWTRITVRLLDEPPTDPASDPTITEVS